jgi:hypothetical protein
VRAATNVAAVRRGGAAECWRGVELRTRCVAPILFLELLLFVVVIEKGKSVGKCN